MATVDSGKIMLDNEDLVLDLPFKGDRDYLRLADIFPAVSNLVCDRFGTQAQVDSLTIRRPLNCGILVSFQPLNSSAGTFCVRCGSESIRGWIDETDRPASRRISYDSSPLKAVAVSESDFARLLEPLTGHTEFDVLAGLMTLVAGQVNHRFWWWCQLHLDTPLTKAYPIEVRIRHNLGGRCIVFDILQTGAAIGSARFMVDSPNP